MRIAPARVEDAAALTDLHLDVWEEAYARLVPADVLTERRATRADRVDRWRGLLSPGAMETLLAWSEDGTLVGFASTGPGRDGPHEGLPGLELMALYVRASAYGTGVGHALLTAAVGTSACYLWVLDGNDRAVAFYERQGFRSDGARRSDDVGSEHRMVRRA
ncbi:GNAT superfamily N-acetyltransferase [Nocardioides cavernae]|uniref:GNAT superfamily N-acetyltransferase n=1 Tax=Nocardioides cavernae TaxID=1921566 RepID=A0A7Y9H4G4_9ACTN|nr:GNAT family N-acetyltransferase [Nocardioides cavernae]NYE37518.1 GNAT superfamily N-acetyltransferase [Nocardioides cavernae]